MYARDDYKRCVCDTHGDGEDDCPQAGFFSDSEDNDDQNNDSADNDSGDNDSIESEEE